MTIAIDPKGEPIYAKLEVLNTHIGTYAVDIWNDVDRSQGPSSGDTFAYRAKEYSSRADEVELGAASNLNDKIVQLTWLVRKDPEDAAGCRVSIHLKQGPRSLPGFPKTLEKPFRDGKHYDIFQVWYYLHG